MLSSLLRTALIAATVIGSIGAVQAAPRDAAGVIRVDDRDDRRDRWERRHDRRDRWEREHRRGDRWERGHRGGDNCSPRLALRKARDMGVRGGDVVRANRRSVTVAGFKRGYPTAVRFAQDRGCPVIGYR